ncbi:MAG: sigma 54-interacting transcriptional regulator, partial [Acidobacteriota bacterium]
HPRAPCFLDPLGAAHWRVFPLAGARPLGRLWVTAGAGGRRLAPHKSEAIEQLCRDAAFDLERARAHRVDERFAARLRRITETELSIRLAAASLDLVAEARAALVCGVQGEQLRLIEVRAEDRRQEPYLYQLVPYTGSHLHAVAASDGAALVDGERWRRYSEAETLAPLWKQFQPSSVETVPIESAHRLFGGLTLFYEDRPPEAARAALDRLAQGAAGAFDRVRPERRHASSLLYLQELLRSSRGGLESVLRTVVEEVVTFMGADAGVLALIDAETGGLLLAEHSGYTTDAVVPESVSLDEPRSRSILAHVVRTGEPYVASDTERSKIYLPVDSTIRSEIAVPLRLHGETVGVVLGSSRSADFFLDEDAIRFQVFADQVAVAVDNARLLDELRRRRAQRQLGHQRRHYGFDPSVQAADVEYHFGNLVGDPRGAMGEVFRTIERVANREQDIVLILGETGTGKEMVAHALHAASPRTAKPLVATNFAALGGDPNLVESELFGHEKGAFTGAVRRRRGCFERAHESTLLIDELGDIVPSAQVKLLRVLARSSRREFQRLGGEGTVKADVRVIAATHRDLRAEVAAGRFREDLYYRLSALMIRIPALRERPEDIPLLVKHFLPRLSSGAAVGVEKGVVEALQEYAFPGNVRQLESVLLRALVMYGGGDRLSAEDIRRALEVEQSPGATLSGDLALECPLPPPSDWFWEHVHEPWKARRLPASTIRRLLERSLEETGGFYSRVATRLGVAREDYQRFLDFLKHGGLKVDHRPYRRGG